VLPDPIAGFKGPTTKGKEGRGQQERDFKVKMYQM